MTTIADIRRGDRFTWNNTEWVAYDDARHNAAFDGKGFGRVYDIAIIPASAVKGTRADSDCVVDLGARLVGNQTIVGTTPTDIRERGIKLHHVMDDVHEDSSPEDSLARLRHLAKSRHEVDETRDIEVRRAITLGVPVVKIAEATGLSRARIYQIRDGRR